MIDRARLYLAHLVEAIAAAQSFTVDGRVAFLSDAKTQSAVIRQIEIMGEAVKRLSDETKALVPGIPWRLIAGTRDRLFHAYFQADLVAVWSMVEQDLPALHTALKRLHAN